MAIDNRHVSRKRRSFLCAAGAALAAPLGWSELAARAAVADKATAKSQWEDRRTRLQQSLWGLLGATRLPESFEVRRQPYREVDDPVLRRVETLWPELGRRRLPAERRPGKGLRAERVSFPGIPGEPDIVGVLRTPERLRRPATAVLCLHGHARGLMLGKEITECYSVPVAEQGYLTFATDAMLFGQRRRREHDGEETRAGGQTLFLAERIAASNALLAGRTLFGMQLVEHIRSIDFLRRIPGIERVAVVGHSMGGCYAFWLAALDERVDAAVCLAGLLSYSAMVEKNVSRYHAIYSVIPGLLKLCDTPDIVSLIAPRWFFAVHAEHDAGFPSDAIRDIAEKARKVYGLYGAKERLVSQIVPGGHGDVLTVRNVLESLGRL